MWWWSWNSRGGWGRRSRRQQGVNWVALMMLGIFITVLVTSGGRLWWLVWVFPFWFFGPGAWNWMQSDSDEEQEAAQEKRKREAFYEDNEAAFDEKPKREPQYLNTPDGEVFEVVDAPPDNKNQFNG